jgi:hypothetical protein
VNVGFEIEISYRIPATISFYTWDFYAQEKMNLINELDKLGAL